MADPVYTLVNSTGTIVVDSGVILEQVAQEYKNVFGQDLVVPDSLNPQGATTPQGVLIVSEALARIAVAENNAQLANQINPNLAGGVYLDAILALTGTQRTPATHSTLLASLSGVVGTSIPAGSQVQTAEGILFQTIATVVIPDGGQIDNVVFESVSTGEIPCNANALTTGQGGSIVSDVLGWETVVSNTQAELGTDTQSDESARIYRNDTLALQGASTAGSIIAGVSAIPSVKSIYFLENVAATTETIEGVTMVSHSIYACVYGGSNGVGSSVDCVLTGTPATVIPAGSQVSSTNGMILENSANITLDGSGNGEGTFTTIVTGEVAIPPNTVTTIVTPVSGWSTVNNPGDTVLGVESDIAQALVAKKSAGAAYNNGNGVQIQAQVIVPYSGQEMIVLYDNPNQIAINVKVNAKLITPVFNPVQSIKDALIAYANGEIDGIPGLTVGQAVSSFELSGAITALYPGIYVQSLLIAKNPTTPTASTEIAIAPYEIAIISEGNISVTLY